MSLLMCKSIFFSFNVIALLCASYGLKNDDPSQLPPPENEIWAREQLYIKPFKRNHDEALTCGQLIVSRGFKYERHFVTTEDGYILQLYRIINPYAQAARGSKLIPVLLVHGNGLSCGSWMFNGYDGFIEPWIDGKPANVKSNNLAFVLANREFDVWLANNRGTTYSLNHTHLDPSDSEFWNFTFSEMAKYDAPAMVDYIIDATEHDEIVWIGYSQGTIQMLIQLAENPSFADKLYLNINIAPEAFYGSSKGLFPALPRDQSMFSAPRSYYGPVPPFLPEFDAFLTITCTMDLLKPVCIELYSYIFGPDRQMIDEERFQVLTSLIDTQSNKNFAHYQQSFSNDQVRKFDYGPQMNLELYGSTEPPKYPFQNVPICNLVLISGLNDYFSTPKDVQKLRNILGRGKSINICGCNNSNRAFIDHIITYPEWSHTDIVFGNQAYDYAHSVIVDIMRENLP